MRVKDYERSNTIHRDDVFLIDGPNGTKTVIPEQLIPYSLESEAWADGTMDGVPVTSQHPAYHNNAKYHSDNAAAKALVASNSAGIAEQQANLATTEASAAGDSADNAASSADEAATYAEIAQAASEGGLIPQGNIAFADLPAVADAHVGDFYVITDDFVSTSDFREGAGISHEGGTAVYLTSGLKWEVYVGRMNDAMPIIAPVEPSPITHAYEIGEKFIYNNILYQATRNISVGDTITPGTNCEEATSLVDQIDNCAANDNYRGWKADFYAKPLEEQMRYNTFDFFDDDDEEPGEAPFITRSEAKDAEVIEGKNWLNPSWFLNNSGCSVNPTYNNGKLVKYTLSGTTTGSGLYFAKRLSYDLTLPVGETFIFSISATLPSGTLQVGYTHPTTGAWTVFKYQSTDKLEFTVPAEAEGMAWTITYVPDNNQTFSNFDIYPMLCTLEEYSKDPRYEPYYIPVKDAMLRRSEQRVLGAKNLAVANCDTTHTKGTVTFTLNTDGTVTANKSTVDSENRQFKYMEKQFKKGSYILNGCHGGSSTSYLLILRIRNASNTADETSVYCYDGDEVFTVPEDDRVLRLYIEVKAAKTLSNQKFYPMLRLASDPDPTYVPYTMTNRELTDTYVNKYGLFRPNNPSSNFAGNCNDLKAGLVYVGNSATNAPEAWCILLTFNSSLVTNNYRMQVAMCVVTGNVYLRNQNNGTWSAWRKVTTSALS